MKADNKRFQEIIYNISQSNHERYNIGTYKEKTLHLALKRYFCDDQNYHEVPVEGFIADIMRDDTIYEIETSGFSGLCPKLSSYLPKYKVNLVIPVIAKKYVSWIDPLTSEISKKHTSPKKENIYDVIFETVRILPYINEKNLTVIAVFLEADEYRMADGWSRNGKRGSHRFEMIPISISDITKLNTDSDYLKCIPRELNDEFTVKDFIKATGTNEMTSRAVIKVLCAREIVKKSGQRGKSFIYTHI